MTGHKRRELQKVHAPTRKQRRHRPDRIIMGEIRNGCAYDLLQAMNTGHGGTMSTIHAASAMDALSRLSISL